MNRPIDIDHTVREAINAGAIVDFSLSGGKDSTAAALAASACLDALNHPATSRSATHAHLGPIEWPATIDHIRDLTDRLSLPLQIVAQGNGLIERWRTRFEAAKRRYSDLECYHLIGPFSSPSLRFCTGEMKTAPIRRSLAQRYPNQTVISVVGIRAAESLRRAATPISKIDQLQTVRSSRPKIISWHPIRQWTIADVLAAHETSALPLHYAYTEHKMTRLSCAFCIMSSLPDLNNSAQSNLNRAALQAIADIEIQSTFSFQPSRWLSDLDDRPETSRGSLDRAKSRSAERRALEKTLPPDLKYLKGWPPRVPDYTEAQQIADVRRVILEHHALDTPYRTAARIIDRFAELHKAKRAPSVT